MKRGFLAIVIAVAFTGAHAAIAPYSPERWVRGPKAIVLGEVVTIEVAEDREIELRNVDGWRFPHSVARIAVLEVLKNETEMRFAAGDTISVFYATSNTGAHPERPGSLWVEDTKPIQLVAGDSGAFALRPFRGELRSASWYFFRDLDLVPAIRAATDDHGVTAEH